MDEEKKEIRKACKQAYSYLHIQNPFGVIFVTLFDKDGNGFFEFQYDRYFPKRDKEWVRKLIDERKKSPDNNEDKKVG